MSSENNGVPQMSTNNKVRRSCDTCQASKIRCGQQRPACQRCAKRGIQCVYSISRRAGRPRPRKCDREKTAESTTPDFLQQNEKDSMDLSSIASVSDFAAEPFPAIENGKPEDSYITPQTSDILDLSPDRLLHPSPSQTGIDPQLFATGFPHGHDNSTFDPFSFGDNGNDNINGDIDTSAMLPPYSFSNQGSYLGSALTFDFLMEPSIGCEGFSTADTEDSICTSSDANNSMRHMSTSSYHTNQSDDMLSLPLPENNSQPCQCSARLLRCLTPSDTTNNAQVHGENRDSERVDREPLAERIQRSKTILDSCRSVLNCLQCKPSMSSALMICQALDYVSVVLGTGTLWEGQDGATNDQRFSTMLGNSEETLQYGSYSVKGPDCRALLKTLFLSRFQEMQRIKNQVQHFVRTHGLAVPPLQTIFTGLVLDLKDKITSRVEMLNKLAV